MKKARRIRLLFIDPYEKWLTFVKSSLANTYEVSTGATFNKLIRAKKNSEDFDLVFIDAGIAQENIDKLTHIIQLSQWHFVVFFPGSLERERARVFFRAGVQDSLSKPYDPETLLKVIEEQINYANRSGYDAVTLKTDSDLKSQTRRLQKLLYPDILNCC